MGPRQPNCNNMQHEMETGCALPYKGVITLSYELQSQLPKKINGHRVFLRDYIRDHTRLQEGPLCPPKVVPWWG